MADTAFVLDIHNYIPNISYTFSYDTVINVDYAGFEYRYPKLFSHKLSINISDYVFQGAYGAKCSGYSKEDFLSFFDSVRGCQDTFLVRCMLDYRVGNQVADPLYNYSGNKVFSDGLLQQVNTSNLNEYIFIKRYAHDAVQAYKTLYNLDYIGNIYSQTGAIIPTSQYSINCNLAGNCKLVRNEMMPVATTPTSFDGTYRYRVRFANPNIDIEQVSADTYKISSLELISHVEPESFKLFGSDFPRDVTTTTHNLLLKGDLSNSPSNSIFPRSATEGKPMQTFTYGWRNENLEANSTGVKAVSSRSRESLVSVPGKSINTLESRLLLNQFLANKGRLLMFNYKYGNNFGNTSVKARFDTDSLTFNMRHLNETVGQDCEGLYEVNNLSFKTYPTSVAPYLFDPLFNPENTLPCVVNPYPVPDITQAQDTLVTSVFSSFSTYSFKGYASTPANLNRWDVYGVSYYTTNVLNLVLNPTSANGVGFTYNYYRYDMTQTQPYTLVSQTNTLSDLNYLNLISPTGNVTDPNALGGAVSGLQLPSTAYFVKNGTSQQVLVTSTVGILDTLVVRVFTMLTPLGILALYEYSDPAAGQGSIPATNRKLRVCIFQNRCPA